MAFTTSWEPSKALSYLTDCLTDSLPYGARNIRTFSDYRGGYIISFDGRVTTSYEMRIMREAIRGSIIEVVPANNCTVQREANEQEIAIREHYFNS